MKTKKNPLYSNCSFQKKKLKTFCLYFPDFFQVWKIAGQISRLFQEFKTLYETCQKSVRLIGYFEFPSETGSVFRRTVLWVCFEDAIASFIGCYKVAQETGTKLVPQKSPIMHFDTRRRLDCFTKVYKPQTDKQPITTLKQTYKQRTKKHNNKWQLQYVY